jgi:hypothetical protein
MSKLNCSHHIRNDLDTKFNLMNKEHNAKPQKTTSR